MRESCEREKEHALAATRDRLTELKNSELQKLRDALAKERDQEIRVLNRHNEELVQRLKADVAREKDDAVKVALELQKKALCEQRDLVASPGTTSSALVVRLQRENKQLKETNQLLNSSKDVGETCDTVGGKNQHSGDGMKRDIVEMRQEVADGSVHKNDVRLLQKEPIVKAVTLAEEMAEEKTQVERRLSNSECAPAALSQSDCDADDNRTSHMNMSANEDIEMVSCAQFNFSTGSLLSSLHTYMQLTGCSL